MQSERQQQSWRLHVTAKATNFNFRLRFAAATFKPTWNFSFFRLSILLKLPKFALTFASHPAQPAHGRGFFTTKFMKIVHKLRPKLPKQKESNIPYLKDPLRIGFWVMGILAFVAQFISMNGQQGILMLGVGYLLLLFWKMKITKLLNLVTFFLVVVGTIFYYLVFNFDCNYSYWEYMGRSWNKMVNFK
ncbi:unnamed protein product [Sphenostylis stenocarpa]|uniref:Uncharacterized protein n=1 Tax=Sphenostylis stenocarpa TaxID=92480 RepID=A0AA86RU62_9FABA|nr:unnamed protein product [Sphenostylis stenocarpa]